MTPADRLLVAFIAAGIATIVLVLVFLGVTPAGATRPAQPVRSNIGYDYVCVGDIPQVCTMLNPRTGQPATQIS